MENGHYPKMFFWELDRGPKADWRPQGKSGPLEGFPVDKKRKEFIKFIKDSLRWKIYIPYMYRYYGFHAARQLFDAGYRLAPRRSFRRPTLKEIDEFDHAHEVLLDAPESSFDSYEVIMKRDAVDIFAPVS